MKTLPTGVFFHYLCNKKRTLPTQGSRSAISYSENSGAIST